MVTWEDGAIRDPPPAPDEAVRAAEDELRVDLPPDLLAVARVHQGARPVPSSFTLPDGAVTAVAHLLHFEPSPFTSNILAASLPLEEVLDKGVIPFAQDIGGDVLCFSFHEDYDAPPVVFWSVDTGPVALAPTFTAFVELLHA